MQTIHPNRLLAAATAYRVHIRLVPRVGDHLVAGTVLAWMWARSADEPAPDPALFRAALDAAAGVGFERTMEQDAAFGIRQLADMACKALSPAVNDPYTAIQSIDHLAVILCALATRRLGDEVAADPEGRGMVVVPGRRFEDYLSLPCGLIRRYGASEPTVSVALIRLLDNCAAVLPDDPEKWAVLDREGQLIVADATREIAQPADLVPVSAAAARLHEAIKNHGQFGPR